MARLREFALYLYLFSLNFEVWDPLYTDGHFSISKLTAMIYFALSVPAILKYRISGEMRPIVNTILIYFSLLLFMNALNAESFKDQILDNTILQNIVLFWILINHEQLRPLVLEKGMLAFALGSTALAILFYNGIGIEYTDGRVSIFGDNENVIGQRMCISLVIVFLAVFQNRLGFGKHRYLLLLSVPVMLGLLVASGSRLAIVSFILVFAIGVGLMKTKSVFSKLGVYTLGFGLLTIIGYIAWQNEILQERLLLSLQQGDLSNRDFIWENILPIVENHPFFGVGESGYISYCLDVFGRSMSPHSVIMELLCFTGAVGLLIYLLFIYRIFRRSFRSYLQTGMMLPMLLIVIVVGMLLGSHILELKLGWAVLAYIACGTLYIHEPTAQTVTSRPASCKPIYNG